MTNPMYNPPQNYSGVTIQISNPAVNVGQRIPYCGPNQQDLTVSGGNQAPQCYYNEQGNVTPSINQGFTTNPQAQQAYPIAYPPQYYLNNYNYQNNGYDQREGNNNGINPDKTQGMSSKPNRDINTREIPYDIQNGSNNSYNTPNEFNSYKQYAADNKFLEQDFTKSKGIIDDLSQREAEIAEQKKNTKETKIVALTDEYIKSLENYLNNPNDEIRLMASKEILTRLDEDKDRANDAALNALLNKMMQDPSKLIRIAALSAFASGLATGNNYTVQLLHNIQSNPNADKEDVLQAADILLKMTAGTEVKNIPNPQVKEQGNKG